MGDSETTDKLIDQFFRCINERDLAGFADLLDENIHFTMIGSTALSGRADSREQMMAVVGRVADYVDENFIHLEELDRIVAGDRGAMRSQGSARTRDGRAYHNTYMHMVRIRDGRFVEFVEYLDTELINRVLLAPASGSEAPQEDFTD